MLFSLIPTYFGWISLSVISACCFIAEKFSRSVPGLCSLPRGSLNRNRNRNTKKSSVKRENVTAIASASVNRKCEAGLKDRFDSPMYVNGQDLHLTL